ncbi:MAG TPA: 16S rRNA (adenine(1518)-N(6)/adenine(1519)-N(6))-dimethyltransferase RsmA [Vicinamibacterales bacterium]|nr:16S rRNA (adenine(1518)-N(6)/adenine(1519)-N(6))-dimethyltransferase RsmA [Vicinamibacterales bacterium]
MRPATDRRPRPARPRARKRFGQHFLEAVWARKVVEAIHPQPGDAFIEIGPGPGAITRPLAAAAGAVVACEIDRDLAAALRDEQLPHVVVVEGDFLTMSIETLREALAASAPDATSFRVAGNLPYNVASPIMFRLVELARLGLPLADATVMLQREVADRLLAQPGTADYGLLTVLLGHRARVSRLLNLPPGAFRPAPKVRSTVVRLAFHDANPPVRDEALLAAVTAAVFSRRRKTMNNALLAFGGVTPASSARALAIADVDPSRRPETLSRAELCRVADAIASYSGGNTGRAAVPPVL